MNTENINILIFGCSKRAEGIENIIENMKKVSIIGYVDNDDKKWGTYYFNKKVYSPDDAYAIYSQNESVCFLIAPFNYMPIYKQLKSMGVNRIYVNVFELLDSFASFNPIIGDLNINNGNKILLIGNGGLPREDELYRSGFIYRRMVAYKNNGVELDAYGYIPVMGINKYEYEGNIIYEGDGYGLSYLMSRNNYSKILLHFPTEEILYFIEKYIGKTCKVYIWLHGFEVLNWERRVFNYSEEEIQENYTKLMKQNKDKKDFFSRIFQKNNYSFVFVSNWLKDVVEEDIGVLPRNYRIIPNYIDEELFSYHEKKSTDAAKVLLVKSNKTRVYANDIAAKAIESLADRECFEHMEFNIYGDGKLFYDNYKELIEKNYPNVHIHKRFLKQSEIAKLHKSHGIFLCPTRQDTQGVSMCEAMSSGLVVVTNKVAAVPEYIDDTVGILCDYEDYLGMADAIERLYYDRDLFLQYSKKAPGFIREKCGFANTIQKELDMINE